MESSSGLYYEAETGSTPHTTRTRRFSLAIIVLSSLCFFNSLYNSLTSTSFSLYSSILFLLTSLGGLGVGSLGFYAFKTACAVSTKRYFVTALVYAVVYVVSSIICSVLEVLSCLQAHDETTTVILVSSFLACSILAAAIVCVLHVFSAYNFHRSVSTIPQAVESQVLVNDKLGHSSLHPIRTPVEIQLNTRGSS